MGEHYNRREMLVWLLAAGLLVGVAGWSVNRHVLRPLAFIGQSLESGSLAPLARLPRGQPEFARLSGLIREVFRQREALRHEIEERARLGRDLHDGVIQNLYATGMGLAQGVRLIESDAPRAAERLQESLRLLNETMEVLRGYIARAEPEAAGEVDIADACVTLFQTLRVGRECEMDLDVEPAGEAEISSAEKATLLFIVREAISNALRHGEAKHVAVSLKRAGGFWRLGVKNDGRPHDFARSKAEAGRGLSNIRARAAELGGEAVFSSSATGVSVAVEWPMGQK
jgi:signal transduction histidine kinase